MTPDPTLPSTDNQIITAPTASSHPVCDFPNGVLQGGEEVKCDDDAWPQDVATYVKDVAADGQKYPVAGAMAANTFACAAWHFTPRESLPAISGTGPRNILLVNNRRDPVTPLSGPSM